MFTRHAKDFANVNSALAVQSSVLSLSEDTLLETPTGWTRLAQLSRGDAVATLDGGFAPITWVAPMATTRSGWHVPARALNNCSDLVLSEDTFVGLEAPLSFEAESDMISLPLAAFEGVHGIRRVPDSTVVVRSLGFANEEMIWAQTGALVHARPMTTGFFQCLSFAQARAMLALREAGHYRSRN